MFSGNKIISIILGVSVAVLAGFSGWLYLTQQDASAKLVLLEKQINVVSANEKDTAKEVARMLGEFDTIAKKQAIETALQTGAAPKLQLPLGCTPGVDCWIFNYVDADASEGNQKDYSCGNLTYDGHKGTDFAIRDMQAMETGVPVFVAAPGEVVGVRDGMPDVDFKKVAPEIFEGRECGNGVRVSHGGEWFTQYCHLKKGSIIVKKGERVDAGKSIGFVGLSGKTEFPHLHFQISKGRQIIDPYIGTSPRTGACGVGREVLWDDTTRAILTYQDFVIYNGGFHDQRPLADGVHRGLYKKTTFSKNSLKLFLWFAVRNVRIGDEVVMRMLDPNDKEIGSITKKIEKQEARSIQILDVTSQGSWPVGEFRGEITVIHKSILGDKKLQARRRISIR